MFLKPVWLYLPDGSKERIIAQTGNNTGIGFDSIQAGVERRHYFKYDEYSITKTEEGDYVVSPDNEYEKIYYPNGIYEYVSKVVPHDGFWEVHVRRYSSSEWRIECWSRHCVSLEHKSDGWYRRRIVGYQIDPGYELKFADRPIRFHVSDDYDAPVKKVCRYFTGEWCIWYENGDGGEAFLTFDEHRYELACCDDILYIAEICDDIFYATEKNSECVSNANGNEVTHPSHYAALAPEPITFIRDKDYLTGSALKYIFRAGHKEGADENVDMGKAAWYLRELVNEQGDQTVIAILRNVYWDTIDRQLTPEDRAREVRDRLTEFMSTISHNRLGDYIPEEK
nr:MAG TPA: nucelotide kinase [Caudoviricetes sp.]